MNWLELWRLIAARIEGLMEAANYLAQILQVNNTNTYGGANFLAEELASIMDELKSLLRNFGDQLPKGASDALEDHITRQKQPEISSGHAAAYMTVLAQLFAFRSRFDYLLNDAEEDGRTATELSFEHLQRLIAVDDGVRATWKQAWQSGEVRCEKIGSVHLLSHGIWAFKAVAKDSATDLVYGGPLVSRLNAVRRTARAIVLTEWKIVRDEGKADSVAESARIQAKIYASGVLGHLELRRTRYVILVSEWVLNAHPDIEIDGVTYRHIGIAVDPLKPSVQSKKKQAR